MFFPPFSQERATSWRPVVSLEDEALKRGSVFKERYHPGEANFFRYKLTVTDRGGGGGGGARVGKMKMAALLPHSLQLFQSK